VKIAVSSKPGASSDDDKIRIVFKRLAGNDDDEPLGKVVQCDMI
jgi:hypothetical protein